MSIKIIHIHRAELYNKVWEEPVMKVAEEYGISGNALKKICNKLNVPVPYNGYWRRLETKHDVFQPPLPHLKPGEKEIYELKIEKKEENILSDKYRTLIEQEENPDNKIIVKKKLTQEHFLIKKTREILKTAHLDNGLLRIWREEILNISVSPKNLSRALRIFNTLLFELEKRGFIISIDKNYHDRPVTTLLFDGISVDIELRELLRIERVKKERSYFSKNQFEYERKLIPTGILKLEIKNFWNNGTTRIVKDKKNTLLEDQLNFFIICIYRCVNYEINKNIKWEAERKIREEEERIIKLKLEEEKREQEKTERLFELAEEFRKYDAARQFVDLVENSLLTNNELSADKKDWIVWARSKIEQRNPIKNIFEP